MREIIFVAGIHGVGKTTFCNQLSEITNKKHFSCSDLIRTYKTLPTTNKFISEINSNQKLLKKAIDTLLNDNDSYILDGHFCLLNTNHEIVKLPIETFEALNISKVILLSLDSNKILKNLESRDNALYSLDLITEFATQELNHCKFVCNNLNIPFKIIRRN
ncbi:AAA family ATPase [Clostridium perfringens]|uniref:ATP-binding protein n=1 Tax=Clostridium perfringens TaxID=1502 RepID=UPI000D50E17F|nr:ATP-binding protein [Clostridium perfringens]PVE17631.1 AAA family ATPase [Clostridium perfringens]